MQIGGHYFQLNKDVKKRHPESTFILSFFGKNNYVLSLNYSLFTVIQTFTKDN